MRRPSTLGAKPANELHIYYGVVLLHFASFGLQFVLFPSLVAYSLKMGGAAVGLAQTALSAPFVALILFGGLMAERAAAGPTLARLKVLFALPPLGLAIAVWLHALTYPMLIWYALAMGSIGALMLPIRDAALNGVVERDAAAGRSVSLTQAATVATAVQIGAQILGILIARLSDRFGAAPLLAVQSGAILGAAFLVSKLRAPRPEKRPREPGQAFREIWEGLTYSFKDPVMGPMIWSAAYVGVFVMGVLQALIPLLVRDLGGEESALGGLFACFFGASFVAAIILGRLPTIQRPGRVLLCCHLLASGALASFAAPMPFWLFTVLTTLFGAGAGVALSMSRTITQSAAAPALLGRVLAVYSLGFMGGAPVGSALAGAAYEVCTKMHWPGRLVALGPAACLGLATLSLLLFSPIWKLERK